MTTPATLPIAAIHIDDNANGRAALIEERVHSLARQLAHEPLLHPVTVRRLPDGYHLIAGRHRIAAYVALGRPDIPVTVIDANDLTAATLRLAENVSRSQLSPVEEATQLAHLVETNPGGAEAVAASLGRGLNWLLDRLDILAWPPSLLAHVHAKRIPLTAAKLLAQISPPELREQRIADAANHGCSAKTARLWLQHAHSDDPNSAPPPVFASQIAETHYQTETKVLCFGCQELKKLETTHSLRWCDQCITLITAAQQPRVDQESCYTPPIYDPPPPTP